MKYMSWLSAYSRYRLLEMFPGVLVWSTLLGAVVVTFLYPLAMIYVVIIFDFYWMIKVVYISVFLVISFREYRQVMQTDWVERCERLVNYSQSYHVVFIPHATESEAVVAATFAALAQTTFPKERIIIVFAAEERFPASQQLGHAMAKLYAGQFRDFLVSVHPDGRPGEIAAKGANLAWAGRMVKDQIIDPAGLLYDDLIVTVLDVDSCVEPNYFNYLTYVYLTSSNPTRSSYQPIPMFNNNIWDAPAVMRVAAAGTTFWLMAEQVRPERLFTFSSHSMSWRALVDVGFWQTDVVSDDSRIFLQCFLEYDGDYRVTPLHMPIYMDTVCSDTWWKSLKNLFKQQQRWAWGSENIPYMLWHFPAARRIPLRLRLRHLFNQIEGMWSWGTASLLIFFLGYVPLWLIQDDMIVHPLAATAPLILQVVLSIANIGLILSVVLGTLILPSRPQRYTKGRWVVMIAQWLLLPVSMIIFGAFPAISSQTRLLFGKYLGFYVTEKSRRT